MPWSVNEEMARRNMSRFIGLHVYSATTYSWTLRAGLPQSKRVFGAQARAGGPARRHSLWTSACRVVRTTKYSLRRLILLQLSNWNLGLKIQEGTNKLIKKCSRNAYLCIYSIISKWKQSRLLKKLNETQTKIWILYHSFVFIRTTELSFPVLVQPVLHNHAFDCFIH
jgi:hypothetical protein